MVGRSSLAILEKIEILLNPQNNYYNYRKALKNSSSLPTIPYFGTLSFFYYF